MPQVERAVSLSEAERDVLSSAVSAETVNAVVKEARAALQSGRDEVRALTKTRTVSPETVASARKAVQQRLAALDAFPEGEVRNRHRDEVAQALQLLDEAGRLLEVQ